MCKDDTGSMVNSKSTPINWNFKHPIVEIEMPNGLGIFFDHCIRNIYMYNKCIKYCNYYVIIWTGVQALVDSSIRFRKARGRLRRRSAYACWPEYAY